MWGVFLYLSVSYGTVFSTLFELLGRRHLVTVCLTTVLGILHQIIHSLWVIEPIIVAIAIYNVRHWNVVHIGQTNMFSLIYLFIFRRLFIFIWSLLFVDTKPRAHARIHARLLSTKTSSAEAKWNCLPFCAERFRFSFILIVLLLVIYIYMHKIKICTPR